MTKLGSALSSPAKCPECGALSAEGQGWKWPLAVFHGAAPLVALYGALLMFSWWPLIGYLFAVVALVLIELRFFPLHPVTEAAVRHERRFQMLALVGFLLLIGIAALTRDWA
jgi:hypothetical protein